MIRKLIESDQIQLLEYLQEEETLNIYTVNNIHLFGLESDAKTYYGEFDEDDNYLSMVILFTNFSLLFYSANRLFNTEWLEVFSNYELSFISGEESTIKKIIPYFKEYNVHTSFLAEASKITETYMKSEYEILKMSTEKHFESLYYLLKPFFEFRFRTNNKTEFINTQMKYLEYSNTYYIKESGKVISSATVNKYCDNIGIVGMVATDVKARKRGLATLLLKQLMYEYIEVNHKTLCLFYDNLDAGKIYKRLGFKDVHKWTILIKD